MDIFNTLGFRWDRNAVPAGIPVHSVERACFRFHRMLPEFVWDAGVLEGNPFTFPEVLTLLDGVTVGGRKISDQEQILNLAESAKLLLDRVKTGRFAFSKALFVELQGIIARNEALEWGLFRGEGKEKSDAPELNRVFREGVTALEECPPFEKAAAFFLFGALQQFFFDGNKRSSRLMMNGILMSNGMDAISVPAARAEEFNTKMVNFYRTKDGTEMVAFLASCHPDEN
jgi:prophage maintenance system killer protein